MQNVANATKTMLAASGVAFALTGFAMFGGIGHAAAAPTPDSGTYDEMVEVHGDSGVVSIADDDGMQADWVQSAVAWTPGWVTGTP